MRGRVQHGRSNWISWTNQGPSIDEWMDGVRVFSWRRLRRAMLGCAAVSQCSGLRPQSALTGKQPHP
eukprot:358480-Chlamydomonas_euryale.AAC.4